MDFDLTTEELNTLSRVLKTINTSIEESYNYFIFANIADGYNDGLLDENEHRVVKIRLGRIKEHLEDTRNVINEEWQFISEDTILKLASFDITKQPLNRLQNGMGSLVYFINNSLKIALRSFTRNLYRIAPKTLDDFEEMQNILQIMLKNIEKLRDVLKLDTWDVTL